MKKHFIRLGNDIASYGVMGGISSLFGIVLLAIFTRILEPNEFGVLELAVTFTTLTSTLIRLSLTQAIARYYFESKLIESRARMISTIFVFMGVSGVLLVCLCFLLSIWLSGILFHNTEVIKLVNLSVLTAYFSALSAVPLMVLRLQRKILKYNIVHGVHVVTYASVALYFVFETNMGIVGILAASMVAAFLELCFGFMYVKSFLIVGFSKSELSKCLRYSLPLFPSVFVGWVNKQVDRIILLSFLGLSSVGLFGAGAKIASIVLLGTMIFRQAWNPYAMSMLKEDEHSRNQFFRQAFNYFAGVFAVIALALVAVAPELFSILVHENYQEAYVIVPWVAGAAIMQASIEFSALAAVIREKTFVVSLAAWIGAFVNILVSIFLIPLFGISGAAVGGFVAAAVSNVILIASTSGKTSVKIDNRILVSVLAAYVIGSSALIWLAETYVQGVHSLMLRISIFLLLVIFIAVCVVDNGRFWKFVVFLPNRYNDKS